MKQSFVKRAVYLCAAVVVGAALAGCAPVARTGAVGPIATPQHFTVQTVGYSVENRPIDLYIAGNGPETVFIFSTIHGDEQAGIPLSYRLMDRLRGRRDLMQNRTLLIMPNANPDGVVRNTRGNANGVDLNRNFPAENRENSAAFGYYGLSEPESRILYDLIHKYRPVRIVSIHQPLKCIDYDGPAEQLAHHMGAYCHLPVRKLGARPGSFGSFAGEKLGIPVITLELERADDDLTTEQLWQRYGAAMLAAISYPNHPF